MSGETEADISAWTIDSLRYHLEQIATDLDLRYEQRFVAQEKAVAAALVTQEKAVAAALAAQKEAVNKSEASYDKRFEAVNEFRKQLADLIGTFLPRNEYRAAHDALVEKVDAGMGRLAERMQAMERKLEGMSAQGAGLAEAKENQRHETAQLLALGSVIVATVAVAVTLILALNG